MRIHACLSSKLKSQNYVKKYTLMPVSGQVMAEVQHAQCCILCHTLNFHFYLFLLFISPYNEALLQFTAVVCFSSRLQNMRKPIHHPWWMSHEADSPEDGRHRGSNPGPPGPRTDGLPPAPPASRST